jgi:hypothetical protein
MVGDDVHSVDEIKTVRIKSVDARIEREHGAPVRFCLRDKPIEQKFAEPFRAVVGSCYEVVDVHEFSACKVLAIPIAGSRADFSVGFAVSKEVTVSLLAKDLGRERWFVEMGAQLVQDRIAAPDVFFSGGESDGGSWHGAVILQTFRVWSARGGAWVTGC